MTSQKRTARSGSAGKTSSPKSAKTTSHKKNGAKNPKKKHKGLWWKILLSVIGAVIVIGGGAFAYLYATTEIPQPEKFALAEKTSVYYSDGTTKIGSFAEQNRDIIDCSVLPKYVGEAMVASEDRSFYTNKGIDPVGIARALINNLTTGSRQGGSTITQQYVERYYLGETTSYTGKLREAILAIKIAHSQDKEQVLCNYMNTIYLGRGAYGIQAAAQAYFGKDAKDLTLPESAMIAGIIPAPSNWDPSVNPKKAQERYDRVLRIMKEDGYITKQQADESKFPQTVEVPVNNNLSGPNGYLLTTIENELINSKAFTKDEIETGGYKIISTLDKSMQDEIQQVGDERPADMPASIQVGGIAVDPRDGTVKAMYAGDDYLKQQLNNTTQAQFQPGSTMKPFGLLGAAQDDVSFATLFNGNSPERFEVTPDNYAEVPNALNMSWGNINLKQATANSVNTVFMNVNEHLTSQRFAQIAHDAGITSKINPDTLYNILGINASTAWDLAQGHSTIANNGVRNTLHIVSSVTKDDEELYKPNVDTKKVFDENDCALVQNAMLGTTQYGTAAGTSAALGRPVAGKSGTANDMTAASFVGYTPQLLNVWAIWNPGENGSAQEVPEFAGYGVSSTGYPSHLFTEFMSQALAGQEIINFPTAVDNGKIGGPDGDWGLGAAKPQSDVKKEEDTKKDDSSKDNQQNNQQNSQQPQQQTPQQTTPEEPTTPSTKPETPTTPDDNNQNSGDNSGTNTGGTSGGSSGGSTGNGGTTSGNASNPQSGTNTNTNH